MVCAVKEGIALVENGLSPYSGDIFHEVQAMSISEWQCLIDFFVDSFGLAVVQVPTGGWRIYSWTVLCGMYAVFMLPVVSGYRCV